MTTFYWLALGILGVWRVTHLLAAENGPWDAITRARRKLGDHVLGRLFDCFYCLSLWVSAPFAWALGASLRETVLLWLAMSGGAILLERVAAHRERREPLEPLEPLFGEDDSDGVLRKTSSRGEPAGSIDR